MIRLSPFISLLAIVLAGCAIQEHATANAPIGKVTGVYVEAYTGVYVDTRVTGNSTAKPLWAHVTFARPLADGRRSATALLHNDLEVEAGDLVQVRLAGDPVRLAELGAEPNLVTHLVAKRGSVAALGYDKPARPSMAGRLARVFQ
jgi:hypothetical protein